MPRYITLTGAGVSDPIPLNRLSPTFNVGLEVIVTGTNVSKVQYTLDDLSGTLEWFDHPTLNALSASASARFDLPCTAVRLNVTSFTNGSVKLGIVQTD